MPGDGTSHQGKKQEEDARHLAQEEREVVHEEHDPQELRQDAVGQPRQRRCNRIGADHVDPE